MKTTLILFIFLSFLSSIFAQEDKVVVGNVLLQHGTNYDNPVNGTYGSRLYIGRLGENYDQIFIARVNMAHDQSELRISIGDDNNDKFIVGRKYHNDSDFTKMFVVHTLGRVGIMNENPESTLDVNGSIKGNKLDIAGTIRSKEVKIEATGWADFVFNKDYKLPTLKEVESHIAEKGTLPDIPSEQEVKENGIDVGEMQAKLLQKIEELTLYVIELKKENEAQDVLIKKLLEEKGLNE